MTTTSISATRRQLDELLDQRERLWAQRRDREAHTLTASIVRLVRVLDAKEDGRSARSSASSR